MTLPPQLAGLTHVHRTPNGWSARCPAHQTSHQSLSIAVGDDGRILVHCFAGCDVHAITRALGLRVGDLFPNDRPQRFYRAVTDEERALYDALAHERTRQVKRDELREQNEIADYIKEAHRAAAEIRAYVTTLGDCEEAWALLERAAAWETEAHRLDS